MTQPAAAPTRCPTCGVVKRGRKARFDASRDADVIERAADAYLRLGTLSEVCRIARQQRWGGRWTTSVVSVLLRSDAARAALPAEVFACIDARLSRGAGRKRKPAGGAA